MDLQQLLKTWAGTRAENQLARWTLPGLSVATALLAVHALTHEPTVVLEPPKPLEEQATVSSSDADEPYLQSWGLYFAQLLGNIHRGNAETLMSFLDLYITAQSAPIVRESIADQVARIQAEEATVSFSPESLKYFEDEGVVAVTGTQTLTPKRGEVKRMDWTYEFEIGIERYKPQLLDLDSYQGPIRERNQEQEQ